MMDAATWREARRLFAAASALEPGEREAFLQRECADATLRAQVEAMLRATLEAGDFLEQPALARLAGERTEPGGEASAGGAPSPERTTIGPWRVLREIGHGGMGAVYLAERESGGFTQRAALKVMRRGMDTELLLRRFVAERQILASLEHPFIARLYDGGSTADGLPYFVMEHVDGAHLLEWCDARRLGTTARVELFRQVCAAVQYAHQRLIVHRDLKPSNILVTADGTPKLLDFGLAKVLDAAEEATAGLTAAGWRPMTPEYASPEQVRGERVTTATDVYSLGVVLYELLTGHRPYRLRSRRPQDVEAIVCGSQPERPSSVVTRPLEREDATGEATTTSPEALSRVREGSVARLRRSLAGDLDTVVLAALRKEPERRYPSAAELSEDLRRALVGLPVGARPDTVGYRARRFARRHRVALAAGLVALLGLATLVGVHTWQLTQERNRARLESAKAQQIASFLTGLFELSDLDRTRGVKLSARDIVDRGAQRLDRDLAGQPAVQAEMMAVIGNVYRQLDLLPQARALLERSLATRRRLGEPADAATAALERDLATLLHQKGDERGAEARLLDALAVEERVHAGDVELAHTLTTLGNVHKKLGDFPRAERELRRAVTLEERAGPAAEADLAKTLSNLGLEQLVSGKPEASLPLFRRALAIQQRRLGPDSPSTTGTLLNLGATLRETGHLEEAIADDTRALRLSLAAYGPVHTTTASCLAELASARSAHGDVGAAKELYGRAIASFTALYGADNPQTLDVRRSLAIVLATHGQVQDALAEFRRVLAGRQRAYGPDHPLVAQGYIDVGEAEDDAGGDAAEAERLMRQGLAIERRKLAPDSIALADGIATLGNHLCAHGQTAEGARLLDESAGILRASAPGDPLRKQVETAAAHCAAPPAHAAG